MKKLMVLGASMTVMLAACGAGGIEGNSYDMEIDSRDAGRITFGEDGELTVEDGANSVGESYEVTDDSIIMTMSSEVDDVSIELSFSYDDLGADVIEGEIQEFDLVGEDLPEEAEDQLGAMNEELEGTAYTLTKVDDAEE